MQPLLVTYAQILLFFMTSSLYYKGSDKFVYSHTLLICGFVFCVKSLKSNYEYTGCDE